MSGTVESEEIKRLQKERNAAKVSKGLGASNQPTDTKAKLNDAWDTDLYDNSNGDKSRYLTSIPVDEDDEMEDTDVSRVGQYTATRSQLDEYAHGNGVEEEDVLASKGEKSTRIADRETDYQKRRFDRVLSPTRADPFANGKASASEGTSYREILERRTLEEEEERVRKAIEQKKREVHVEEHQPTLKDPETKSEVDGTGEPAKKRKRRWDITTTNEAEPAEKKSRSRWDQAPAMPEVKKASRWDQAPAATPIGHIGLATPNSATVTAFTTSRYSDEDLDAMLPGEAEGYKVISPPAGYVPIRAPVLRMVQTPAANGFMMQDPNSVRSSGQPGMKEVPGVDSLAFFKPADAVHFAKLSDGQDEESLSLDELKQRKILKLLLRIKNGTPPQRKTALRSITDNAREFGAGPLFDAILPLLMERTLEDQERHLIVKTVDRLLYKLGEDVRPYTHKILVVIEPLLIDQDYYARVEGREIIQNLAKAAGLATMISVMRADIDHQDEYVRNTTARALACVAGALGVPSLLPFLRAILRSRKSWTARHTGCKIVQQIAILGGCSILPHLASLVEILNPALSDEQAKVRTAACLAIAALAEAAAPFGVEAFDGVLGTIWTGARKQRGKGLTANLKAIGFIISLMEDGGEYAQYYTAQIMEILLREFSSPDEEMRKVVLKVVSQISATTDGVTAGYLREAVLDPFFVAFWNRRSALDKRTYRQVVDTTVDVGNKVGISDILERILMNLKDESEHLRRMTMEVCEKLIVSHGAAGITSRQEEHIIDGMLFSVQEQSQEDIVMLNGVGSIVNALGIRCKPYLPQIASVILWRLNHKLPATRQQAADLVSKVSHVMKECAEDALLSKLGTVLYEYLGEEYPEVLASILSGMRSILISLGAARMQPPIRDLLPRLTPILRNRHEKVQENAIDIVGRIAEENPDVSPREFLRIAAELLEMLKSHRKGTRRAANSTFGHIAKAIGPADVLSLLLNNLRVQERQSRINTAVAVAITAASTGPYISIPAILADYRTPDLNVQNGVIKILEFLTSYIGEMGKDYVYAIVPVLEDALTDRDQVHRQTAASVVKHMALGVAGLGCEDAFMHLLNLLHPNILETSPHVYTRVVEAVEACRIACGPGVVMNYFWAGLFHPARKVREPCWRIFNDAYVYGADQLVPYYPAGVVGQGELQIIL